jgi:hypothetical protein
VYHEVGDAVSLNLELIPRRAYLELVLDHSQPGSCLLDQVREFVCE